MPPFWVKTFSRLSEISIPFASSHSSLEGERTMPTFHWEFNWTEFRCHTYPLAVGFILALENLEVNRRSAFCKGCKLERIGFSYDTGSRNKR